MSERGETTKRGFVLLWVPVLLLLIIGFVLESRKLNREIDHSINTLADLEQRPVAVTGSDRTSIDSSDRSNQSNQSTTPYIFATNHGTATAPDLLSGKTAWVDGSQITGTMPTQTLSAANDTVSAGYYTATSLSAVDTDLTTGNIISGKTIFGISGNSNIVNTSSGTATAGDLLSGQIAYVDGAEVTGTMPTRTLSATNDTVSAGYYTATTLSAVDSDLVTGNIKSGVTIFGVAGNSNVVNTSTGTAIASNMLSGLVAWVDGAEVTGTISTNTLSAANETVSAGYYNATTLSTVDVDLVTGNIKSGVTIFGVSGNSNIVNTSTGTATAGDLLSGLVAWVDGAEVTGTMATQTLSAANETVSAGYYAATTLSAVDTDLATGNILSGTTIFGIVGNSNVVNTSTGDAVAGEILSGKIAWVDGASVTGTMATQTLSALNDTVSVGYYNATTLSAVDADLATGNIRSGITIFGIAGNSNVVNTSTGTATASDILSGLVAWVDGSEVTGTIPTQTLSVLNDTVSAGYYNATTLSAVDTDLATGNIKSGVTIFGISGNSNVVNTSTGTATAGDLLSGLVAWVDGTEVTGTMPTQTLSVLNDTVSAGYYAATTLSAVDTDLATANILSGKTIFGISGNSNVVNTSTGDAIASDLLLNKIAWVDGASVTGTMPTQTLSVLNDTVSAGYYAATTLSAVDTDLATGNILSGTTIFGIAGNSNVVNTSTGDAVATDILSGKIAWVDGASVTGTIATQTLSALNDTVSAGYYNATTLSAVDADLAVGNIISGKTIFGFAGTAVAGYAYGDSVQTTVLTTAAGAGTYDASLLTAGTVKSGTLFGVGLTGDYPSSTYPLPGDTAATDAAAGQILDGYEAWTKAGALVTGTVATQTLSAASQTVSAGYYNATTLSAVDADLAAGNIVSGTVIFGITGTKVVAGACSTQQYDDSNASATEGNNCSLTWTANLLPVTGDDARSGRGGYDPKTGLTWSNYLKNNAGTVEFATSSGSTWNWNGQLRFIVTAANATAGATYTNNSQTFTVVTTIAGGTTLTTTPTGSPAASGTLTKASGTGDDTITFSTTNSNDTNNTAVGGKTAAQLCSDRGNGWRLPSQKELMGAYIDGSYWNLTNPANNFWSVSEVSSTSAWYVSLSNGYTFYNAKTFAVYVRCVR